MRDKSIPFPCQDRWIRLGPDSGHGNHRQTTETDQRHMRQLHHQVGLDLRQNKK